MNSQPASNRAKRETTSVAAALLGRMPDLALFMLRNLIVTDLKPYLDAWDEYDFEQGEPKSLSDQLSALRAELIRRGLEPNSPMSAFQCEGLKAELAKTRPHSTPAEREELLKEVADTFCVLTRVLRPSPWTDILY